MCNGMGLSLQQVVEGFERVRAAVPAECSVARMLGKAICVKWLASFVSRVGKRMCVNEVR